MDKTLLKGLMVLEAITDPDDPPKTIDALAARIGLTRSNAHRTLQTLIHAGYVAKDEAGGYRGTVRLFELGARQLAKFDVRKLALAPMRRLADQTGETIHLSVLDGMDVIYIDKIDSPQPIRAYSVVGGRAPAYAVATGKALLAHQPEGYVEQHADRIQAFTKSTLATLPELKEELSKVAQQGYAINRGEWRDNVAGLAVAIFNNHGQAVAALGISGPLERLGPAKMKRFSRDVIASAHEVSVAMGYQGR